MCCRRTRGLTRSFCAAGDGGATVSVIAGLHSAQITAQIRADLHRASGTAASNDCSRGWHTPLMGAWLLQRGTHILPDM